MCLQEVKSSVFAWLCEQQVVDSPEDRPIKPGLQGRKTFEQLLEEQLASEEKRVSVSLFVSCVSFCVSCVSLCMSCFSLWCVCVCVCVCVCNALWP